MAPGKWKAQPLAKLINVSDVKVPAKDGFFLSRRVDHSEERGHGGANLCRSRPWRDSAFASGAWRCAAREDPFLHRIVCALRASTKKVKSDVSNRMSSEGVLVFSIRKR